MSGLQGLLGLDRKAMEEERLARLAKRSKRPAEEAPDVHSSRVTKLPRIQQSPAKTTSTSEIAAGATDESVVSKSFTSSSAAISDTIRTTPAPQHRSKMSSSTTSVALQYPYGSVKQTWSFGHSRHKDCKIEEILQRPSLTTALISSWQWDFDWLVRKLQPGKIKFIFVMEAKSQADKDRLRGDFVGLEKSIRLCFPPMSGNLYARMHSKLMLLFHPTHLRIVIPSANPVGHDWGESGLLENTIFVIDLPRLPISKQGSLNPSKTQFARDLLRYLGAMEIPDDVKTGVLNFDFTATLDLAFVHSIPGSFDIDSSSGTGLLSLSHAVRTLNLATPADEPLDIQYASSSLGALDTSQMHVLDRALRGLDPAPGPTSATKAKSVSKEIVKQEPVSGNSIHILFPSQNTVTQSTGGTNEAAGTIFLKATTFDQPRFPRDTLRDYISHRAGLLSHNKLILVRSSTNAYLYTGSANFSQSAWGRISRPKGAKAPKITVANWECGVLVPVVRQRKRLTQSAPDLLEDIAVPSKAAAFNTAAEQMVETSPLRETMAGEAEGEILNKTDTSASPEHELVVLPMSVFEGVLDLPFEWPAREYRDGQRPWCT